MVGITYLNGVATSSSSLSGLFTLGYIDKSKKTALQNLQIILLKPDGTEVSVVKEAYDIETTMVFKDIDEISFSMPYYISKQHKQVRNPNWDRVKNGYLIKVNNKKIYYINEVENNGNEKDTKRVHCYSREFILGKRKLRNFQGTRQLYRDGTEALIDRIEYSLDGITYATYTAPFTIEENKIIYIRVYDGLGTILNEYEWVSNDRLSDTRGIDITYSTVDAINFLIEVEIKIIAETGEGILNILEQQTSWSVGYIDPEVREDRSIGQNHRKYRTFDISEKSWLEILKDDIQKSFDCVIQYDTINKKINIYHINTITENKGLYISEKNYLKSIKEIIKDDEVVTRLKIYGKDNLGIADINPTGKEYIDNFSYYRNLDYMPQHLLDALDSYDSLVTARTPLFYDLLQELKDTRVLITKLTNELVDLQIQYEQAQDNIDTAIRYNEKNTDAPTTTTGTGAQDVDVTEELVVNVSDVNIPKDLTELNQIRDDIQILIDNKKLEIQTQEDNLNIILTNIENLRTELDESNNFTIEQLDLLDNFIFESTWSNANYSDSKELLSAGKDALDKLCKPIITKDLSIIDFLNIIDCQKDWDKLVLGDIITIHYDKFNLLYEVRLVKIVHNIDDNSLSITISNKEEADNSANYLKDIMSSISDVSNSMDIFKNQWNLSGTALDLVSEIMGSALDTAKNRVLSGRGQNIRIDERGILLKSMNNENDQLRILNDAIVFSNDGFQTANLALSSRGIVGENIYGKVVGSNKLIITNMNDNGESSFLVDGDHMKAINMDLSLESKNNKNRIYLNPEIGLKLQKRTGLGYPWEDIIYLDGNDGSVWAKAFHIINTHSVLDDKGLTIDNGCIWINNEDGKNVFEVNTEGEVDAMGRFRVFRDTGTSRITLADLYKDDSNGGKLLLNDWYGRINAFLGSAPDSNYTGGFLKLYNGSETKERIELGVYSASDMGVMKIKNNSNINIVEITGNDNGGTIKLNNKLEETKLFMSSQDENLNQGIIKLYGEDNQAKLIFKAKSSVDNMSDEISGDRRTGGFIQLNSYDGSQHFFLTVNNENNCGMYDESGSAFELNHSSGATIMSFQRKTAISLSDGSITLNTNDLNGLRVAYFSGGEIKGAPTSTYKLPILFRAGSNFSGVSGTTINHNFGDTNYAVAITPIGGAPTGTIGEISVSKSATSVTVYNSGSARSGFDCIVMK